MRLTDIASELEQIEFAREAAAHFAKNSAHWSYSRGEIQPGERIAMRWGLGDDCVLVFRIGDELPTIFAQAIRHAQQQEAA